MTFTGHAGKLKNFLECIQNSANVFYVIHFTNIFEFLLKIDVHRVSYMSRLPNLVFYNKRFRSPPHRGEIDWRSLMFYRPTLLIGRDVIDVLRAIGDVTDVCNARMNVDAMTIEKNEFFFDDFWFLEFSMYFEEE